MSSRTWRGFAGAALSAVLAAGGCGSESLVGGGCREGLSECSLRCVDLQTDRNNCGACGRVCGGVCSAAKCGGDGGVGDGGVADGSGSDTSTDGIVSDVSAGDGVGGDGVVGDAPFAGDRRPGDGSPGDGSGCMPPFDTAERCGDCTTRCVDPTPVCGLQGTFKCLSRCEPPLEACGPICINKFSDDKNCGMCGRVCASGICQAGMCAGKGYGHEVVIGMDYSDSTLLQSSAQVTLLGNAVFQSSAPSMRVLVYDEFAEAATVARIETWLSAIATTRGKTLTIERSSGWTSIPEELTILTYQVFLVYDQLAAPRDQMETSGTLWNATLSAYARAGGVIVALDGGSVGRMRDLLTHGGLLPVTDETDVTGTQLTVDAPTDVVGQNLPNILAARRSSVAFTTPQVADNLHVFVVKDSTGMRPVVVHSVPPQ